MNNRLTQDELKRQLHYEPKTGVFTRLVFRGNAKVGDVAGNLGADGYVAISINNKNYRAHRLAWFYMTGEWPNIVDHEDHIKNNNIWTNLKNGTHSDNLKNKAMRKNNTSGFNGVCWNKQFKRWQAYIKINRKRKHLGFFKKLSDAVIAREEANVKHGFHVNHGIVK